MRGICDVTVTSCPRAVIGGPRRAEVIGGRKWRAQRRGRLTWDTRGDKWSGGKTQTGWVAKSAAIKAQPRPAPLS